MDPSKRSPHKVGQLARFREPPPPLATGVGRESGLGEAGTGLTVVPKPEREAQRSVGMKHIGSWGRWGPGPVEVTAPIRTVVTNNIVFEQAQE